MEENEREMTAGDWATEVESMRELDRRLAKIGHLFDVSNEYCCHYLHPRLNCETGSGGDPKTGRIDRVLMPKAEIIKGGWNLGAVGIEGKRSGEKIGRPICQAIDYTRAAYTSRRSGVTIMLSWVFIWPLRKVGNSTGSIMAQNKVGSCFGHEYSLIEFGYEGANILRVRHDGTFQVGNPTAGSKAGHR